MQISVYVQGKRIQADVRHTKKCVQAVMTKAIIFARTCEWMRKLLC